MRTLYEFPPTRSQRAKWALEELSLDYQSHRVDLPNGEHLREDFRALHPLGVVPVLDTGEYRIYESTAIVLTLIDECPNSGLAPPPGTPERATYLQWAIFAPAEMEPAIMAYFDNSSRPAESLRPAGRRQDPEIARRGKEDFAFRAAVIDQALGGRNHLLDPGFSGADIIVGHACFMARVVGLIGDHPPLADYLSKLAQRPAFRRVYADYF